MTDSPEGGKQLVKLMLDADAATLLLQLAGGPRKQGDYVSKLIRAAAAGQMPPVDLLDRLAALERELSQIRNELVHPSNPPPERS